MSGGPNAGKRHGRIRLAIQLLFAALLNGYAAGFARKKIFTGKSKYLCVPVLNCYSCPGALGSCPIGSLQAVLSGTGSRIPFYVLGTLVLFGTVFGRLLCGFVCPFGLIQDLLSKIPVKKLRVPEKIDRPARYVKYGVLLILVILLPLLVRGTGGVGTPFFCKYLCPAGTLEGAVPLVLLNQPLRALAGPVFGWKMGVMAAVLLAAILIPRFFCRYLCPLGAFYGLFNRFSIYRMQLDRAKCIGCGACEKACPMAVKLVPEAGMTAEAAQNRAAGEAPSTGTDVPGGRRVCSIQSPECIRCGKCRAACPAGAIERRMG